MDSILSAAVLNRLEAFRKASSLPPTTNCASKDCTEGIGAGFITDVAVKAEDGRFGMGDGSLGVEADSRSKSRFLASDISPRAMLYLVNGSQQALIA